MKAVYYEQKGPARQVLQAGERPLTEPQAGEVRVRIHVSAVNPSDTKGRGGYRGMLAMPFPMVIPHQDGAGVIDAVGPGVDQARIGQRVWVYEATLGRPFGTCAEYTTVPEHKAVPLPDAVDFEVGACMGIPAMTAHRCVLADGPVKGKTVLVQGGAGAVGFYAVQIAKLEGARVIATVSRDEQAAQARLAGADHVINYKTEDVARRVKEITGTDSGLDRVIEVAFGVNLTTDVALLNGIMHVLIDEDLYAHEYVDECTLGFRELAEAVAAYPPEKVAEITGIPAETIRWVARELSATHPVMLVYTLGITEHTHGVDNVLSCANLQMLLGGVGFEGGGVNPLRGQNNVQGACDMGALPDVFSGYQKVDNPEIIANLLHRLN